jgi:hypothetical protein
MKFSLNMPNTKYFFLLHERERWTNEQHKSENVCWSLTNTQLAGKGRKTSWKDGIPGNVTNPDFFRRWKESEF